MKRRRNIGFEEALAERLAEAAGQIPAGRVGAPGEYGPMGAFLASDRAPFVDGVFIICRYGTSSRSGDWMWTNYRK